MEQFKQFNVEKQAALKELEQLRVVLNELGDMGADVSNELQKIDSAIRTIESDVLRIALLGAFSDGKTSVIAAWMGKVMADMKIDMDESSDRLAIYSPEGLPEKCEIVDTPGLFGDKEKLVDGEQVMYEDLTKRYISEAHLILYVVDASVPLDENDAKIMEILKGRKAIVLLNKSDLTAVIEKEEMEQKTGAPVISISAREETGMEELEEQMKKMFFQGEISFNDEVYITNARHKQALLAAKKSLELTAESIEMGMPEDFFSIDLMNAYEELGSIIGEAVGEDLVNEIFSKFCTGK